METIHIILALAAVLGTFTHWLKSKWTGETIGNPIDYLIANPWSTLAMAGSTFAAVGALIGTGAVDNVTYSAAFWIGFATGYTTDNALNKGPNK